MHIRLTYKAIRQLIFYRTTCVRESVAHRTWSRGMEDAWGSQVGASLPHSMQLTAYITLARLRCG